MPPAAIPIAMAAGGAAAGSASSKKGNSAASRAADRQYQIQQQQLAFGKDVFNKGMTAWQPAADYWSSLLSGDPTKMAGAISPTANTIRNNTATTGMSITNLLPQGGEKNLASATNLISGANQLGQLTAGVQPTAAAALGQLAGLPVQAGVGIQGQGAPNVSSGLKYDRNVQQQKGQTGAGLGGGLGQLLYNHKNNNGGGSSSGGKGGSPVISEKG